MMFIIAEQENDQLQQQTRLTYSNYRLNKHNNIELLLSCFKFQNNWFWSFENDEYEFEFWIFENDEFELKFWIFKNDEFEFAFWIFKNNEFEFWIYESNEF